MTQRVGLGMTCSMVLAALVAGCSDPEAGPTNEAIRAEMDQVLQAFERHLDAKPDEAPAFYTADTLRDFMGIKALRYRAMGVRMLADGTWLVGKGRKLKLVGATLIYMDTPDGAKEALASETEGLADAGTLGAEIPALRNDRTLAFTYGAYYVSLGDLGELEGAPSLLRKTAEALVRAMKETVQVPPKP